jgi:hypothetical protein
VAAGVTAIHHITQVRKVELTAAAAVTVAVAVMAAEAAEARAAVAVAVAAASRGDSHLPSHRCTLQGSDQQM